MTEHNKEAYYFERTLEHIHRVQKNMLRLVTTHKEAMGLTSEECQKLMYIVMRHDRSKFSTAQFLPYIELTEFYRQKKVLKNKEYAYSEGVEAKVREAIEDHYIQENHHPEGVLKGEANWNYFSAMECVCDLQAMAQEFGEGSSRGFWENVWIPKYENWFRSVKNWKDIKVWMGVTITCFEKDIARVEEIKKEIASYKYKGLGTVQDHIDAGCC